MTSVRRLHAWCAILAAPTLLFFASTGIVQLFDLHETHAHYRAPALLVELARLHKEQKLFAATSGDALWPTLLRLVFCATSLLLLATTLLGLVVGLRRIGRRSVRVGLLAAGAALPLLLAALTALEPR